MQRDHLEAKGRLVFSVVTCRESTAWTLRHHGTSTHSVLMTAIGGNKEIVSILRQDVGEMIPQSLYHAWDLIVSRGSGVFRQMGAKKPLLNSVRGGLEAMVYICLWAYPRNVGARRPQEIA